MERRPRNIPTLDSLVALSICDRHDKINFLFTGRRRSQSGLLQDFRQHTTATFLVGRVIDILQIVVFAWHPCLLIESSQVFLRSHSFLTNERGDIIVLPVLVLVLGLVYASTDSLVR